jgi:predicted SAM-dependent methyltransferase
MCDIDIVKTPTTDYVLDAGHLPFPDDSIEQIESYHMVEHIPRNELPRMVSEWHRVLEPGGLLVLELPAFDDVVAAYLETDDEEYTETLLRYVFGSQRFQSDYHYWGWNESRLGDVLRANGFENVTRKPATDSHAEEAPCMRIEAFAVP